MGKRMKLSTYLLAVVLLLALLSIATVWPLNQWTSKTVSETPAVEYAETDEVGDGIWIKQEFFPEYNRVDTISVLVRLDEIREDSVLFQLFSPEGALLKETTGTMEETELGCYITFPVYMTLQAGSGYSYSLNYLGTNFTVPYDAREDIIDSGNGNLFYMDEEIANCRLITAYQYEIPLERSQKAEVMGVILAFAFVICVLLFMVARIVRLSKEVRICAANLVTPLILFVTVFTMLKIWPGYLFSDKPLDILVYEAGVLFLGVTLMFGSRQIGRNGYDFRIRVWAARIPNGLQILFFAGAVKSCCDFVNSISNYDQQLATRMMMTFFGLAIIAMFEKKELLRIWNYVYLPLVLAGGYLYVRGMEGEAFEVGIRTAAVVAVWGIVVMNTIYNLNRKNCTRFAINPAILWGTVLLLMVIYRHVYTWPVVALFVFGLFYLRRIPFEKMNQFLGNAGNGILLSFVYMMYQALRYRPFHNFRYVRYSGMFHTVTYTTVFYALVFTVALCKLFAAYRKSPRLKDVWKELCLVGIVCGYQFLCLSRTGTIASIVAFVTAFALYAIFEHRDGFLRLCRKILLPLAAFLWFIPIVFTVTRIVPALTNEPHIFMNEEFVESIREGDMINSRRYITVERFLGLSEERMLGKAGQGAAGPMESSEAGVTEQPEAASMEQSSAPEEEITYDVTKDYSNGRFGILKEYLKNLNMTGHETISLALESGENIIHAHNSFVQVAYDSGVISGILFFIACIWFGVRSIRYYVYFQKQQIYAMLPLLIFITFGVCGIVEYTFRPTVPIGFAFLLMFAPLLPQMPKLPGAGPLLGKRSGIRIGDEEGVD